MDVKVLQKPLLKAVTRPTQEEAEAAVRTLIAWAGDNPNREGLLDTPRRVAKAYREYFAGYEQDPADILNRVFEEVGGYDDMVMLRGIPFTSHCEHHIAPFHGHVHIAYLPNGGVVGISKLARVVEVYARRLQTRNAMVRGHRDAVRKNHRVPRATKVVTAHQQPDRPLSKHGSQADGRTCGFFLLSRLLDSAIGRHAHLGRTGTDEP